MKREKGKGEVWRCVVSKKDFKGRNGTKAVRKYEISVLRDDIKACIVTVITEMKY